MINTQFDVYYDGQLISTYSRSEQNVGLLKVIDYCFGVPSFDSDKLICFVNGVLSGHATSAHRQMMHEEFDFFDQFGQRCSHDH